MAKTPSLEERLAEIGRLIDQKITPELRKEISKHLASKTNLIAAKAADVVTAAGDRELANDLIAAFQRFMINPVKTDKGCFAKTRIIKALLATDCDDETIFLHGIRHRQLEPGYGGPIDTATELRALSGLGLIQIGSSEAMTELGMLLADREADARIGAVHALGQSGSREAIPLLRFKALIGDSEPGVIAECFTALMSLSATDSLAFVAGFVDRDHPALSEAAALTLGESHLPEAFEALRTRWEEIFDPDFRRMLLLPIAMVRSEGALEFLLARLDTPGEKMASAAISALAIYRGDEKLRDRVNAAVEEQDNDALRRLFKKEFG